MTLELSGMKIITVLAMIHKVFCMMGRGGGNWKKKAAVIVIHLKTMDPMFISTKLHSREFF